MEPALRRALVGAYGVEAGREAASVGQRRLLALIAPDQIVELPIANGRLVTRQAEATAVRDALEGYRELHCG